MVVTDVTGVAEVVIGGVVATAVCVVACVVEVVAVVEVGVVHAVTVDTNRQMTGNRANNFLFKVVTPFQINYQV